MDFATRDVHKRVVDVVAAKVRVAVRGKNLVDIAFAGGDELQDGDIERAAAKIVDGNVAALLFVQAIGERGSGRLVDQAQDFEAGKAACILGGLALRVVEIRRDGDDCAVDGIVEKFFGPGFKLAQNERGNFWRREEFIAQANADHVAACFIDAKRKEFELVLNVCHAAAHQALHGINSALGMREQALAGGFADEDLSISVDAYDRGAQR